VVGLKPPVATAPVFLLGESADGGHERCQDEETGEETARR
jgi:hypothetical protein